MRRPAVLTHRQCGHVVSYGDRPVVEAQRSTLAGAGHYGWRVRVAVAADLAVFAGRERCEACTVPAGLLGLAEVEATAEEAL
jgi:hypothetical protein